MGKKLYVGNIAAATTREELERAFGTRGTVISVKIIQGRNPEGPHFGFVEMENDAEANQARRTFNGYVLAGNRLTVNEARAQN